MHVPVSLPLDHDGFLRRQCSSCGRQFKWHHGPVSEEAEAQPMAERYFCPLCGVASGTDDWLTDEQREYVEAVAMPYVLHAADEELSKAFKGFKSKNITIKQTGHLDVPDGPMPLTEPDDMTIVVSPCHGWEPVKVPEGTSAPLHCLVCGAAYAV